GPPGATGRPCPPCSAPRTPRGSAPCTSPNTGAAHGPAPAPRDPGHRSRRSRSRHQPGSARPQTAQQLSSSGISSPPSQLNESTTRSASPKVDTEVVEALERTFPLRVLRYRLRRGSGGAGAAQGGKGIERDLQVLADCTVSLITERRVTPPWGLAGGEPGAVGENWLLPGGDASRAERLPDKCTIRLTAGDVLRMLTPGGGGWGRAAGTG